MLTGSRPSTATRGWASATPRPRRRKASTGAPASRGNLGADADLGAQLAEANLVYEQQFGRIFLLCAAGKSAAEVLRELRRRLRNDPAAELREAAEQQRRITQLRLRRWLGLPPSRAEDV